MLTNVHPMLPMRNKDVTKNFYVEQLGFIVDGDWGQYLIMHREQVEIHFFLFEKLDPKENYGQVYIRTNDINTLYNSLKANNTTIHPNGDLATKPWGQIEFSLLDPDTNLLIFGQEA